MSLINEALKRTRDASFQAGNARPMTVETYRVSGREESPSLGSRSGVWVSLLVLVMAAVAVLVFALRVVRPGERLREALNVAEAPAPIVERAPSHVEPAIAAPVVVAVVPAASALADPAPGTGATTTPAPPAPEVTKFVLQGIISAATWREATINGYALREGDEVDGAKVIAIESRRVKLQLGDREILLRMP